MRGKVVKEKIARGKRRGYRRKTCKGNKCKGKN